MKPLLKWAGGKRKLAPRIDRAFGEPCRGTYFEPFCGAASVFLYRRTEGQIPRAVLADANPRLMALYQALQADWRAVESSLRALPSGDDPWKEAYYGVRQAFNDGPVEGPEQAARLVWLNRTCFNGLYRESRKSGFNVPVGRHKSLGIPSAEALERVAGLLEGVELVASGFEEVMARAGEGDQVYCDPPYVPLSATAHFTTYSGDAFDLEAQRRLAEHASAAAERGAAVVLSNHDTKLVRRELYPQERGFKLVESFPVGRSISRNASKRGAAKELLCRIG